MTLLLNSFFYHVDMTKYVVLCQKFDNNWNFLRSAS